MTGPQVRRILAVKLADFGDALLTTPALRSLRAGHPDASLDVLTTPQAAPVYAHSGLADDVIAFEKEAFDRKLANLSRLGTPLRLARHLRGSAYDAVVTFHHLTLRYGAAKHAALALSSGASLRAGLVRDGSNRGWFLTHRAADPGFGVKHEVEVMTSVALAAGGLPVDMRLSFQPGEPAETAADRLLASHESPSLPCVALHPGSGGFSTARRWPPEHFAAVADAATRAGALVLIVGRAEDDTARVIATCDQPVLDLTDRTDLPTLAAVLARCDVLVCGDSGVMHLATAMSTPVVAVFGPSNDLAWGPWWPNRGDQEQHEHTPNTVVSLALPCRPCLYRGHALGAPAGCPTRDCLVWLQPTSVTSAVLEKIAR